MSDTQANHPTSLNDTKEPDILEPMSHDELKKKGNDSIVAKDYDKSIHYYTLALGKDPQSHTVLSNRSLAYSKLDKFKLALVDAESCIEIMPSFARGYLRKSVACYGLGQYDESMRAAQDGYKLRGSDAICKDSVSQWILACKEKYQDLVEKSSEELGCDFPRHFMVTSTEYFEIYLALLIARLGLSSAEMSYIKQQMMRILDELNNVLKLFGHMLSSVGSEWCHALAEASKLDPKLSRVPRDAVDNLMEKSQLFCEWLDKEIDILLFPIVRPILSLLLVAVGVFYINLNIQNTDQNVTQVICRSVLAFFKTSVLSTNEFVDQHITVYKEMLEAFSTSPFDFTSDEKKFINDSIKVTEELIQRCPKDELTKDICDKAMASIGLMRIRFKEAPGVDFTELAKNSGKGKSKIAKDDPKEFMAYVTSLEEELQYFLHQTDTFPSSATTEILDLLDCVGTLIELKEMNKAVDIIMECQMGYISILFEKLGKASFTLDEAPSAFNAAQSVIFAAMYHFIGKNDAIVADIVLKWKCINSKFRIFLLKFDEGKMYLRTFQAIQEIRIKSVEDESKYFSVSEEHQEGVKKVIRDAGQFIFTTLARQTCKQVMKKLQPHQVVLEYVFHTSEGVRGELIILSSDDLSVFILDGSKILALLEEWDTFLVDIDENKARPVSRQLCELLIPEQVQAALNNSEIDHIYLCPDAKMSILPLELLEFPDGQLLKDKCPELVYLSCARELLRKETYENICEIIGKTKGEGFDSEEVTCVIVADPNYDLKLSTPKDHESWGSSLTSIFGSFFPPPSKKKIKPVANSTEEATDIERLCSTAFKPITTQLLLGDAATLIATIQLKSPTILHFVTHGFAKRSESRGVHGSFWSDTQTGLLLAGVNTYRSKDFAYLVDEAGTGELTSLAVCGMDLSGTKLVYLSTCISSIGFHTFGESVNNLAQAFRAAGAQSVIATLFPIIDEPARKFAIHFYFKAFQRNVRPSAALSYAKDMLRQSETDRHRLFWCSFVCMGEDTPLFQ
jgi:CHAT domain-containing protein/tetratricopeptide (TPR) repeat protein